MSDDIDWQQLRAVHRAESEERLASMESALLDLERDPANVSAVESLRRDAHTLKGNAGIFGFDGMAAMAHAFEDGLDSLRRGQREGVGASPSALGVLLQAVDMLRAALPAAVADQGVSPEQALLIERLRSLSSAGPGLLEPPVTPARSPDAQPANAAPDRETAAGGNRAPRETLRVEAGRVDSLVELASEISIARGRIESVIHSTDLPGAARQALEEALPLLGRLTDVALGMRLVPFGPIFATHRRTARDAAVSLDREVRLDTAGDDVEIDLALVDRVNEVLLHLVRNAVAHGIEPPQVREASGKPAQGTIRLSATAAGGQVILDVIDDGAGLDLAAIRDRARRLGMSPTGDDEHDAQLVFAAGLSTAAGLSEISGRGVGLASVKASVERLAGSIEVRFEPGIRTQFRVRIPLTLAMIHGLFVGIGTERYVLPMDMVRECLEAPTALDFGPDGLAVLAREAMPIPVVRLGERFLENPGRENRQMVVVSHGAERLGLIVDRILGEGRVVVKPIGHALRSARCVFGAAILGDGYVALILDVPDILSRVPSLRTRPGSPAHGGGVGAQ